MGASDDRKDAGKPAAPIIADPSLERPAPHRASDHIADPAASDAAARVYSDALLRHAAAADAIIRLSGPSASATAVSPICGSIITADLIIGQDGRIGALGFSIEACALTKTVVSVLHARLPGKALADVRKLHQDMETMLQADGPPPAGDFGDLAILQPVKDFKARHNAILLPFVAIENAFAAYEEKLK